MGLYHQLFRARGLRRAQLSLDPSVPAPKLRGELPSLDLDAGQQNEGRSGPDLPWACQLPGGVHCTFCNSTLRSVLFTRKRFSLQFAHKGPQKPLTSFISLLFMVARHSIAQECNVFFSLFYLSLRLKSLGSPQDVRAGIFWETRWSVQQHVLACVLAMSSSCARSRPWMGAWVTA